MTRPRHTPLSNNEFDALAEHMKRNPALYGDNVHRLMARAGRTEQRLTQAQFDNEEEVRAYNVLLGNYRAELKRVRAVRELVKEATARMEPVSWITALSEIIGEEDES